jgi:hypothetical protein
MSPPKKPPLERRTVSILDLRPRRKHVAGRIIELVRRVEHLEARNATLEAIVFRVLEVAECEYCDGDRPNWFEIPTNTLGPPGSAGGLMVYGGSHGCCVFCLDKLYEEGACEDQADWERLATEVAGWLLRYRQFKASRFGDDPDVKRLMIQLSP